MKFEAVNLGDNLWTVIRTKDGLSQVICVTSNTDEIPPWTQGTDDPVEAQAWAEKIAALLRIHCKC